MFSDDKGVVFPNAWNLFIESLYIFLEQAHTKKGQVSGDFEVRQLLLTKKKTRG